MLLMNRRRQLLDIFRGTPTATNLLGICLKTNSFCDALTNMTGRPQRSVYPPDNPTRQPLTRRVKLST